MHIIIQILGFKHACRHLTNLSSVSIILTGKLYGGTARLNGDLEVSRALGDYLYVDKGLIADPEFYHLPLADIGEHRIYTELCYFEAKYAHGMRCFCLVLTSDVLQPL